MTQEVRCCLKSCSRPFPVIARADGRVEVKTFAVDERTRASLAVAWSSRGEATFHRECWSHLVLSASTNVKNNDPSHRIERHYLDEQEKKMISEAHATAEYHDSQATVAKEAAKIAKLVHQSRYCIAFTGAGISTAAGIGDFRGKSGKWTEKDRKDNYGDAAVSARGTFWTYEQLRPTYTHEAIAKLVSLGHIKDVISQNCDGLHSLSGIPPARLWELHGNVFHEVCEACGARYNRPFAVASRRSRATVPPAYCNRCGHMHRTGAQCERPGCCGYLKETVINFGDHLENEVLQGAIRCAQHSDLVFSLGTTLQVSPANSLVKMGAKPTRLIICNRQTTPCDEICGQVSPFSKEPLGSRVFGDCDNLMALVMSHLLSQEALRQWECERDMRQGEYLKRRQPFNTF